MGMGSPSPGMTRSAYGSPSGNLFGQPYGNPAFNAGPFSFSTPGYGQQFGAGTYDPMLGFGQAYGMGTTYNYPTRFSADYSRFAQSGMPFNQPVMGYNSFGQIFAQPRRQPAPTMGGKGGFSGFQQPRPQMRRPAPTMGGKGGFGGFQDNFGQQQTFRQPYRQRQTPDVPPTTTPATPTPTGTTVDPNIANSPFAGLLGSDGFQQGFGQFASPRGGMNRQRISEEIRQPAPNPVGPSPNPVGPPPPQLSNPDLRPRFPPPSIDPGANNGGASVDLGGTSSSPAQATGGTAGQNAYNPAFQQQQQLLAQRQRTGRAGNLEQSATRENVGEVLGLAPGAAPYNPVTYDDSNVIRGYTSSNFNETTPSLGGGFGLINPGFGAMQFQEGGQVPPDAASNMEMMLSEMGPANPQTEMAGEYDRLIQMTMQAVLGQTENADEIIKMFIDEFGVDAFRQLRDAVLKQQVPNAQTEGMVDGNGGGMDDQVMGMIGNQRPVAVSPGEYIVPADVVSGLGDGSSKSGADILDELNQAVRMARTGTTEQPRPLAESMR